MSCPPGSLTYSNATCICPVGSFYEASSSTCENVFTDALLPVGGENATQFFQPDIPDLVYFTPANASPIYIFIVTALLLGIWLSGTVLLRFMPFGGIWFKLRCYVSFIDYAFSKKHWTDEQKCQVRRKTELGGTLSIGSFILVAGLISGVCYQYFAYRAVTIQSIMPSTGSELATFRNTLDFNITAISGMKCSQLTGYDSIEVGMGALLTRSYSVTAVANISCFDTENGPMVRTTCPNCALTQQMYFNSWAFVDRPDLGLVASAVGFDFSVRITASSVQQSSVTEGRVLAGFNGSYSGNATLRGNVSSVMSFRLIPRVFQDLNKLQLLQVVYHEFASGTFQATDADLIKSLANPDGKNVVGITVQTNVLSAYLVKSSRLENISPLTLLSNIGGIYKLGILIFFFLLNQLERYFRFLRYDDKLLASIERKRVARYYWRKLRIAIRYGMLVQKMNPDKTAEALEKPEEDVFLSSLKCLNCKGDQKELEAMEQEVEKMRKKGGKADEAALEIKVETPQPQADASANQQPESAAPGNEEDASKPSRFSSKSLSSRALSMPAVPHINPKLLAQKIAFKMSERRRVRRERYRHEDERPGSQSEHKGSLVRRFRNPSWIADYQDLPSVPDIHEEETKRKTLKKIASRSSFRRKLGGDGAEAEEARPEDAEVNGADFAEQGDSEEEDEEGEIDAIDVYNYLMEMHEYQMRLREDFLLAQSMLENVVQRFRPHSDL